MYQTNVAHLETIIHSCIEKSIRLAYISSSTAVQRTDDAQIYSESLPYVKDTDFWYAWTKAEAEQVILGQGYNGLQFYIVRPTAIVGPPDHGPSRFGETLFDLYKGKLPFITEGGYNIIDFYNVDESIGTMVDIRELIDSCHANGMKLILDITPNHVSSEHEWVKDIRQWKDFSIYRGHIENRIINVQPG